MRSRKSYDKRFLLQKNARSFLRALEEMDWTLIAFRENGESKADLKNGWNTGRKWQKISGSHVDCGKSERKEKVLSDII